ncbi:hypothetical protein [Plantibacter sp. RU18]|uniref:hypothetical protein n=1 Tax=Plantibacter sp. RU18 TaxID=3158143 RepID=UPI003D35BDBF
MSDSDGMNELFDDTLRQAVMIAARLGEQAARHRQEQLRQARLISEQAGRQAQARFDAERLSARAGLSEVTERDWWKVASPEQIGAAYQTATAWGEHDPQIAAVRSYLDERLSSRGIDTSGQPETITELIRAREWAAQFEPQLSDAYSRDMIKHTTPDDRERMNNVLVASYLARPESQYASAADDERAAARGDRREADRQRAAGDGNTRTGAALEATAEQHQADAKFPVWEFQNEADVTIEISKERALARLANLDPDAAPAPGARGGVSDLPGWLGIDPDVDAAIKEKFPNLDAREERKARVRFVDAGVEYDSAGRRTAFADRLDGTANQSDKRARMLADISQGTPAVAAVNGPRPNAPKARKNTAAPNRQMRKGSR